MVRLWKFSPAIEGAVQRVEVTSGGNAKITFTNLVKEKGILEIDKEDASAVSSMSPKPTIAPPSSATSAKCSPRERAQAARSGWPSAQAFTCSGV